MLQLILLQSTYGQPVIAVAAETDLSRIYAAYNHEILLWKCQFSTWRIIWTTSIFTRTCDFQKFINITVDHPQIQSACCIPHKYVLGMQLCSVGIFAQRQVISLNNKQSLSLSFEEHDVNLELPAEVLDYSNPSLEVAFAPLGPVGPHFKFPKGMFPVSPAVWLYLSPEKEFHDPATLKLPHCFESKSPDILQHLCFLKADEEDIIKDESGQVFINFRKIDKRISDFPVESQYGTLKDHHFCIYCLAAYPMQDDVIGKVNYCLTILKPTFYPTEEYGMKIYCILHFNLQGCKKVCP